MLQKRLLSAIATLAVLISAASIPAGAQGVTTGAISGTVTDESGTPVPAAQIQVVNKSTGATSGSLSRENGLYFVQGLEVGGPYSVTVRRIGYEPTTKNNVTVALSSVSRVDVALSKRVAVLSGVTVIATGNTEINPTKTGVGTTIRDSALRRMPSLNRNFTDFVTLTPQISTSGPGASGGGVNNRYNNIQIDGASENDLFGLGSTGQPGGQARGKSISVESVKQYQILLSPFDVRQGNFAGAQINAVTKSGTNDLHGSVYWYNRNQNYSRNLPIVRQNVFQRRQSGFTLGGPIIKNRLHFFVNSEWQTLLTPASGPYVGQPAGATVPLYVSQDSITRFTSILNGYGIEAGSPGKVSNNNPLKNVFARIDAVLPWNSRLVLRENYGTAQDQIFSRGSSVGGFFNLTSNAYQFNSVKRSTVGQIFTNLPNGTSNEFFYAYNTIRDIRAPASRAPQVTVLTKQADGSTPRLVAGAESFSHGNSLDQNVVEITDNYTIPMGSQTVTLGARAELSRFRNLFAQNSFGVWTFNSLDSLSKGIAASYGAGVGVAPDRDPNYRFRAATYSVYAQDLWQTSNRFSLTAGLRIDNPVFRDKPADNPLVTLQTLRSTHDVPSGQLQYSPRVGFNWDATGDQRNQFRGGAGIFVGRPAYVWVGNAYGNNGIAGFANFSCTTAASKPPAFNAASIASPPTACGDGSTAANAGEIDLIGNNVRFPSNFRASLGYDRRIGNGWVATVEGLYTHARNELMYIQQAFTGGPATTRLRDRNGRILYGTIATSGAATTSFRSARKEVYDVVNQSKDYSYNFTSGLIKRLGSSELGAYYSYAHSYSVQDLTSSRAVSNWRFGRGVSDLGNQETPYLGISKYDQPHRIIAYGSHSFRTHTDLSFIYRGEAGSPFDYIYTGSTAKGDLNADNFTGNDLVYIPKSSADPNEIRFQARDTKAAADVQAADIAAQQDAFERFINGIHCLRDHRGEIIKRNTCRSPWVNNLDIALRQNLRTLRGQNVSVQLDIFNFANLLNKNWGEQLSSGAQGSVNLLTHVGQTAGQLDGPNGSQGIFTFDTAKTHYVKDQFSSNYRMQLSLRYTF